MPDEPKLTTQVKTIIWPIAKRMPKYLRLAWELVKDPAVPQKHKMLLYGVVVYQVTPIHFVVSPIPIVGQVDFIVILLLAIRQIFKHCPPSVANRHCARLGLSRTQLDDDLQAVLAVSGQAASAAYRHVRTDFRFAGRVAGGVSKRLIIRALSDGRHTWKRGARV